MDQIDKLLSVIEPFLQKALSYYKMFDYNSAIQQFDYVIRLYPDHVGSYLLRGTSYSKLGKFDLARSDLNMVLQMPFSDSATIEAKENAKKVLAEIREREEWLKTDEGQRWLTEEERKRKEQEERKQEERKQKEREQKAWLKTPEGQKWQKAEEAKRIIMIVIRCIIIIFGAALGTFLGLILVSLFSGGISSGYIVGSIFGFVSSVILFFLCKHSCIDAGEGAVFGVKIGAIGYAIILIIISIAYGQGEYFILAALAGAIGGAINGAIIGVIGGTYDYFDL